MYVLLYYMNVIQNEIRAFLITQKELPSREAA